MSLKLHKETQGPDISGDPDSTVLSFPVANEHVGLRLDRFIQNRIPRLSRTRAQEIVRACARRADGSRRDASDRVQAGETIFLVRPKFTEPETPQTFRTLFEDDWLLAVDKPAGLPMHPTATYYRNTLTYLLHQKYGEHAPHIAHRLDRETSGIVVCCKTFQAERTLKRAFEDRRVDKKYVAIVRGEMKDDRGSIEHPLMSAKEGLHLLMEIASDHDQGLEATTEYEVQERRNGFTLVELHPKTGRQHQLRVHLAAIGHPIVGDKLYGPEGPQPFLEYIETGITPQLITRLGHARQALHASEIRFVHPIRREPMYVQASMPEDMASLWAGIEGSFPGTTTR